MGASPKHKLSPEAAEAIAWINADRRFWRANEQPPPQDHTVSGLLKGKYGRALHVLVVYASGSDSERHMERLRQQYPEYRGLRPAEILDRLLSELATETGPFLFRLSLDPKTRKATWKMDFETRRFDGKQGERELESRPILYRLVRLLADMLEKGPERLKTCAWGIHPDLAESCLNFFWDPTTSRQKRYCSEIHDGARSLLRQARQRTSQKKSRR